MHIETFDTEGVLVIANTNKLKRHFADKPFDYAYPEGLKDLIVQGIIHIITTEETVENLNFVSEREQIDPESWEYNESCNFISVDAGDEIRLISHSDFTRICDQYQGDHIAYIESRYGLRKLMQPELETDKAAFMNELPEISLQAGLNKVNVYSNKAMNPNLLVEFMFLFEVVDSMDLENITTEPLEIYG